MKKLLIAVSFAFASTAQAQDGIYAGAHIGQATAKSSCEGIPSCENKSSAGRILGGYSRGNLVAEVGYADLGRVKATGPGGSITITSKALDVSLLASMPIVDRVAVYGRLGAYRAKTEADVNTQAVVRTDSATNNGIVYGLGASYTLSRRLTMRAEWQKYGKVGGSLGDDDVSLVSLGLLFKF